MDNDHESAITLCNGKYEVRHTGGCNLRALRYGELWRDLAGDNLVLALVTEVERLRADPWQPAETVPRDGTEVALLFREEREFNGIVFPLVRAAKWVRYPWGENWNISMWPDNPPIGWHPMPSAPDDPTHG